MVRTPAPIAREETGRRTVKQEVNRTEVLPVAWAPERRPSRERANADVPTGGKFTGYISNKVGVNDAGDVLISAGVDTGNGEIITPLLFERASKKWTSIATAGMPAPDGGNFSGGNSFGSFNNSD